MVILVCQKCGKPFLVKPYRVLKAKFCSYLCAGNRNKPLTVRFWEKVDVKREDECWLWKKSLGTTGYGQFAVNGKPEKAHRIAFTLTNGDIPIGLGVLHKCDTPRCCNPKHLFVGTQSDNLKDMSCKGRHKSNPPTGEKHWKSKFVLSDIKIIRESNKSHMFFAKKYGVTPQAIYNIRHRKTWRHVE